MLRALRLCVAALLSLPTIILGYVWSFTIALFKIGWQIGRHYAGRSINWLFGIED